MRAHLKYLSLNKNGYWYFRLRLNPDLKNFYNKSIIQFSLNTKDKSKAMIARDEVHHQIITKTFQRPSSAIGYPLSHYIPMFLNRKRNVKDKSKKSYLPPLNNFINAVGDVKVDSFSVAHLNVYVDTIYDSGKKNNTIIQNFAVIKDYCKFLESNDLIDIKFDRFFSRLPKLDPTTSKEPFDNSEVVKILEHCSSYKNHPRYCWRHWIILLLFYTGCRRSEICQLQRRDVVFIDYKWCISINDDNGKDVKNKPSIRIIPLHDILTGSDGFQKWAGAKMKWESDDLRQHENLFHETNGYNVSSFFKERYKGKKGLLEYLGIDSKNRSLHCTRNTFIRYLKIAESSDSIIQAIVGHAPNYRLGKVYGGDYPIVKKLEHINKIDYKYEPFNLPVDGNTMFIDL